MSKFQMFDSVALNQDIQLHTGAIAPQGTDGAIVEIFKDGEAYLVELFGGWLKFTTEGDAIETSQDDPEAFRDTLDVETIYPHQINLVTAHQQTDKQKVKQQLLALLDLLPEESILQIKDFTEFLCYKQQQGTSTLSRFPKMTNS
ncbi:MAG: hypothetical protein WCO45_09875 [Pseudanabaena sp. ELA607]